MSKVWLVAPLAIVTLAGTMTYELLLDNDICTPPADAAAASVTVPVAPVPPTTELVDSVRS